MQISAVTIDSFTGYWKINSDPYQSQEFQKWLDQWQDRFIYYIISVDAFVEIADNGINSKQKWTDLFEGVERYYNEDCKSSQWQPGVSEALKGLLYFVYVRDDMFTPTNVGNVESLQEVSKRSNNVHNGVIASTRWNNAIGKLRKQILPFVQNYEEVSQLILSSDDLGAGDYRINLANTLYLYDGDSVKIDNQEFEVLNLVDNTSFEISTGVAGIDWSGLKAIWEPYKDFPLCESLTDELRPII